MIRDLDANISSSGELLGTIYLEGDRRGVERGFLRTDEFPPNAMAMTTSGLSGLETLVNFHIAPPQEGVDRLHNLIQAEGATPPVLTKWGTQIYPAIAARLASPQRLS